MRHLAGIATLAFVTAAFVAGAEASHTGRWDLYVGNNHDTPYVGFYQPTPSCTEVCGSYLDTAEKRQRILTDSVYREEFLRCTREHDDPADLARGCQPLRARPPSPEPEDCPADLAIDDDAGFDAVCDPFREVAEDFAQASCCLQYDLARQGWRGYQLVMGPYDMATDKNDAFTKAAVAVPNETNLAADGSTYEYMVGFEFWQYRGSHHFILNDLLGKFNDPDAPRGDCSQFSGADRTGCENFDSAPERCDAQDVQVAEGCSVGGSGMRAVPLAGSPGPSYFPVPYPDGVGIKLSSRHVFLLDHHVQSWYTPQSSQSWINIYTKPAKVDDGSGNLVENVEKEAHVFFDGSASPFYIPPHTLAKAQGLWVAPRNIELYGLTAHSHKRNILFTADMIGPDGKTLKPVRDYPLSHPACGGFTEDGQPPSHLFESTDWVDHEQCPFWLEDDGDNDRAGALFIRQGEGIRYECFFNNGVLPQQMAQGAGLPPSTGDPSTDVLLGNAWEGAKNAIGVFPARTLAEQEVPVEPRDAFGEVVRGKFSCEERITDERMPAEVDLTMVPPNGPFVSNKPCLPDLLKGQEPSADYDTPEEIEAVLRGGPAAECEGTFVKNEDFSGYQFYRGTYTGNCIPAALAFAETEDDEMCILLGLYAFSDTDDDGNTVADDLDDDVVPIGTNGPLGANGVDRLPTDVGR